MFNVSRLSLIGLHFCCLPRKIFLLGQSGNFSCAQRYSVSQFDNAKVITFRCGSRIATQKLADFLKGKKLAEINQKLFCAVIWSFGHLSKSKTEYQNRHYNYLFIYSEQ